MKRHIKRNACKNYKKSCLRFGIEGSLEISYLGDYERNHVWIYYKNSSVFKEVETFDRYYSVRKSFVFSKSRSFNKWIRNK